MDKIEKIIWTEDGIKSLEEIVQYISRDSTYYAANLAEKILVAIENLIDFPLMGRVVPEYNDFAIRELFYKNYRIVYKVVKNVVYVVLVTYGSKELPVSIL